MMIKFAQLTSDDLNTLGIGTSSFSNYSVKAIDDCNGKIVGYNYFGNQRTIYIKNCIL